MKEKLRIGKIPYLNLLPIYYSIERNSSFCNYEFIEGVPSKLNKMIREGVIDISPSSSIEYLRNPHLYTMIEGHSISCKGCIESILLFSKKPIRELHGSKIYVTNQSETSIALLEITLKKFYQIECELVASDKPEETTGDAFFLIGDDALKINREISSTAENLFIYDLGEIWMAHTNLPFVFALWLSRKELYQDTYKKKLLEQFVLDLEDAKEVVKKSPESISLSPCPISYLFKDEIISYWRKIDYDFDVRHRRALELFKEYLFEISYLN